MSQSITVLTKLFDSRGSDGLSRADRERLSNYNRRDFLFEKFLNQRKPQERLQLTHEHILDIGDKSLRKLELSFRKNSITDHDAVLNNEIQRLENEVEKYKRELKLNFNKQFEEEKKSMKKSYDLLMQRIEKQRDEAEEERMKEVIRKMNEECERALKNQWTDAEELRRRTIEELRDKIRKQINEEMEAEIKRLVQEALDKAQEEFKKRELAAIERTREQCEKEYNEKLKIVCDRYDQSIEALLQKIKELEEKWSREKSIRSKLEADFRLLQTDYKRFMDYTDHYNSDYMMKLRHIGAQILKDTEYENRLDNHLESFNFFNNNNNNIKINQQSTSRTTSATMKKLNSIGKLTKPH